MKMKRIISLFLAVVLTLSCGIVAFADTYPVSLEVNAANRISLNKGDKNTGSFSLAGSFVVVARGEGKPEIQITYKGTFGSESIALKKTADDNGFICEICDFPLQILPREYKVEISSTESRKCEFDLWIIDANLSYSGLTKDPNTSKVYYEDIDVKLNGEGVTFLNGAPDFAGAEFSFRNNNNADILKLTDADVLCVMNEPYYNSVTRAIVYRAKLAASLGRNSTVSYSVKPNPIASVRIVDETEERPVYHFGRDGIIKGTLRSYYFKPDVRFDGITFNVTYKDSAGGGSENLTVQKDDNGYFVMVSGYGRQNILCDARVTENKTAPFDATVTVGGAQFQMTIQIEKAGFFEFIGIWFRLLFGVYK